MLEEICKVYSQGTHHIIEARADQLKKNNVVDLLGAGLHTRVQAAVAFTLSASTSVFFGSFYIIGKNLEVLSKEDCTFDKVLVINKCFFVVVFSTLLTHFMSIFIPELVFSDSYNPKRFLESSMIELYLQTFPHELAHFLKHPRPLWHNIVFDLSALPDQGARLVNWRQELAQFLQYDAKYIINVNFAVFRERVCNYLLTHYPIVEVNRADRLAPASVSDFAMAAVHEALENLETAIDHGQDTDVEDWGPLENLPVEVEESIDTEMLEAIAPPVPVQPDPTMEQVRNQLFALWEDCLQEAKADLVGKDIYAADDISGVVGDSYYAMLDLALLKFIQKAKQVKSDLVWYKKEGNGNKILEVLRIKPTTQLFAPSVARTHPKAADFYVDLQSLYLTITDKRMTPDALSELQSRIYRKKAEKQVKEVQQEQPQAKTQNDQTSQDSVAFKKIGDLRNDLVDSLIMNKRNSGHDFMHCFAEE